MTSATKPVAGASGIGRSRRLVLILAAFATAAFLVGFDLLDGRFYYRDIDDVLRELQIRQLLNGDGWYDLSNPAIRMPEIYVSPWSRIVDLPYVVLAWLFRSFGDEAALQAALHVWQPVLLFAFCALAVSAMLRLAGREGDVLPHHVVAAIALMPLTIWEFSPGRIDHHNVQIVLLVLALYGVTLWSAVGGVLTGVACVLSILVGLELMPLVLLIFAGAGFAWLVRAQGGDAFQSALSLSVIATALIAGIAFAGPAQLTATACDAFSAPYLSALCGYGFISFTAVRFVRNEQWPVRLLSVALPGAGLIAALAFAFPLCLQGPYNMIDPVVHSLWLDRVQQENSFLTFFEYGEHVKVVCLALVVIVLAGALPFVHRRMRNGDAAVAIVYGVALAVFILTLVQTRFIRFPAACAMLFLPVVWSEVAAGKRVAVRFAGIALAVSLVAGGSLALAFPQRIFQPDVIDYITWDACTDIDTRPLFDLPPGRIMAPSSLGLHMAGKLPPGMSVGAVSFHRAAPGMRRMFDFFASEDSGIRRAAVAEFDYVAICRYPVVPYIGNETVYAVLARHGEWPGLERVVDQEKDGLQVFRIDHAALR